MAKSLKFTGSYQDRVVCYLDILGFKEKIDRSYDPKIGQENKEEILNINNTIMAIQESAGKNETFLAKSKMVTNFSDSLLISFLISEESQIFLTIYDVQLMIINLITRGYICRGGLTYGKAIHTRDVVFGPAINRAYYLESNEAKYPRIIVEEEVFKLAKKYHVDHHTPEEEVEWIKELLMTDDDNLYYVDYFISADGALGDNNEFIDYYYHLIDIIKCGLKNADEKIKSKYYWMRDKYNFSRDFFLKEAFYPPEIFEIL